MAHTFRLVALATVLSTAACGNGGPAVPADLADEGALVDPPAADAAADAHEASPPDTGSTMDGGASEVDASPRTFLDRYPLTAKYPEGGTYDEGGHAFYVGSLGDGSVHRVDATTGEDSLLFRETAPGKWWTLGMTVDAAGRRLWVCAMDDRSPKRAGFIWIFDLTTGARVANHALAKAAPDATCTDVALTKDGRGYVGDREVGNIYRVGETTAPELFVTSTKLEGGVVGQNSMVVLPDESALLSLVYLSPRIVRVDLATRAVRDVEITGNFSDKSTLLAGADGMTYHGGSVYVAFTSELVRVTPRLADWSSADAKEIEVPSGMTDVVATPIGLYLLNGQAVRFATGSTPDPFALVRFVGAL